MTSFRALRSEISPHQVRQIVRAFYERMSQDVLVGFFFDSKDLDSIAEKQSQFIEHALGRDRTYSGRPPKQAHDSLPPILRGHFFRRQVILRETLVAYGVSEDAVEEWLSLERQFEDQVVKD